MGGHSLLRLRSVASESQFAADLLVYLLNLGNFFFKHQACHLFLVQLVLQALDVRPVGKFRRYL